MTPCSAEAAPDAPSPWVPLASVLQHLCGDPMHTYRPRARPRARAGHHAPAPLRRGSPRPAGATWDGQGTNFSLFSSVADAVELCLFDEHGAERRVAIRERT